VVSFLLQSYEPAYLSVLRAGGLEQRVTSALHELEDCRACPRNCGVNRLENRTRACHTGRHAIVASAFPHFGEEDCLRGWRGSGTIFFGLCNLRCSFCQNWDISQKRSGRECTAEQIASLMIELQDLGCHNVNFVTPEHVAPQVIEAIAAAVPRGLRVPIVYNTSAYDALSSLRLLDGLVDIYMPDFKFWSPETALRLAKARDYPERAREAILEMHRQVGPLKIGTDGLARRGVLVRHLDARTDRRSGGHLRVARPRSLSGHLREHHGTVSAGVSGGRDRRERQRQVSRDPAPSQHRGDGRGIRGRPPRRPLALRRAEAGSVGGGPVTDMGKRRPSPPRQPRPARTGWDWRKPPKPGPRRPPAR